MSRGMQNLTARYNYIYNSKVILNDYEAQLQDAYAYRYNEILPVYITPEKFNPSSSEPVASAVVSKELDQIISKAQLIIAEKSFSNYIDDAYLLLGKAQFFKGNYFIATEYFDYIIENFKRETPNHIEALDWKARSLMQINNLKATAITLDTLASHLELVKKKTAEPLATFAQMDIIMGRNKEAISYLEAAVKRGSNARNNMRWTYILAQLYEEDKNYEQALKNFIKVQKSNANFELYFNANLNRIKLNALLNGQKMNRKQQLATLLRDDKNADYIDQIYFHIAESYAGEGDYKKAEDNFNLSVNSSTKNQYQKGLSYLKIADLNFKYLGNYLKAKAYYDSTVNTLPKNYPGYDLILKKVQNLEYLTNRYELIATQDTMQALAKLPEQERNLKIQAMFTRVEAQPVNNPNNITQTVNNPFLTTTPTDQSQNSGTFYFSNLTAISKGYSDFKKRWGNRKLEENWRQSIRPTGQTNTQNVAALNPGDLPANPNDLAAGKDTELLIKEYKDALPLNAELLAASNGKIIDAWFEIANFYQQELNEPQEANRIYELLLSRFPNNKYLAAINYSLYLNYRDASPAKAASYKNTVLSSFPTSVYAKTILDPSFSLKQSALDEDANKKYNEVFGQYEKKAFPLVITAVNEVTKATPENYLSPQFAYLKAIAVGRTKPVDSLISAFDNIKTAYPEDKLIVPLVNDHLAYIMAHLSEFKRRKIALTDFDPYEPRFFSQTPLQQPLTVNTTSKTVNNDQNMQPSVPVKKQEPIKTPIVVTTDKPVKKDEPAKTIESPKTVEPKTTNEPIKPVKPASIFSTVASETYYFVIDVMDASLTLSSSRFGIGQFNRGNYAESNLKHQLTEFDDDQLIYVGKFSNFAEAKTYADEITPQLKQIMKVPSGTYKSFVISAENFDKLNSRALVNQYLEFYKNTYQ